MNRTQLTISLAAAAVFAAFGPVNAQDDPSLSSSVTAHQQSFDLDSSASAGASGDIGISSTASAEISPDVSLEADSSLAMSQDLTQSESFDLSSSETASAGASADFGMSNADTTASADISPEVTQSEPWMSGSASAGGTAEAP